MRDYKEKRKRRRKETRNAFLVGLVMFGMHMFIMACFPKFFILADGLSRNEVSYRLGFYMLMILAETILFGCIVEFLDRKTLAKKEL